MSRPVDRVVDTFHVMLLRVAAWAVPIAFVVDSIGEAMDGDDTYIVAWWVFAALEAVVLWQLRRPTPSATWLVGSAVGFIGVAEIAEYLNANLRFAPPDGASSMLILVVLGIYLSLTARSRSRWLIPLYTAWVSVIGVVTSLSENLAFDGLILRTAIGAALLLLGSLLLLRLRADLVHGIEAEEWAAKSSRAAASFSEALLTQGDHAMEQALTALGVDLGFEGIRVIRHEPSEDIVTGNHRNGLRLWKSPIPPRGNQLGEIVIAAEESTVHDIEALLWTVSNMIAGYWERADALERLEDSLASKDRLVASVSHELRTPLTGIVGFSEMILDLNPHLEEEVGDFVRLIHDQSRDMADIIEDLLAAARADIGTLSINPKPIDLSDEVGSVLTMSRIQGLAETRRMTVDLQPTNTLADPLRCRQIIRNLLTNAFRYGGDAVALRMGSDDASAWVEVSDNGPGLDEEERARVFEPYYSARQAPSQPGSVGLGLPVSRQLARLMGGDVALTPSDAGTTFRLTLPLATANEWAASA